MTIATEEGAIFYECSYAEKDLYITDNYNIYGMSQNIPRTPPQDDLFAYACIH